MATGGLWITFIPMADAATLLRLMTWMSPAFPVGAYTYSHGLEWLVETGDVKDETTLKQWLLDILQFGAGYNDTIFVAEAWKTDPADLRALIELAIALNPSEERQLESVAQGRAFVKAAKAGWSDDLDEGIFDDCPYPVAVGAVARQCGLDLHPTLVAYLHGVSSNLISAGVRLIPLGQSDGVRCIAALEPSIAEIADDTLHRSLEDLGGFVPIADIASMKHETQYTRLFRS